MTSMPATPGPLATTEGTPVPAEDPGPGATGYRQLPKASGCWSGGVLADTWMGVLLLHNWIRWKHM
jgi:hypothetical protein